MSTGSVAARVERLLCRVVANPIRRGTTRSRACAGELATLELPHLQTAISEAVAYGGMSFSGTGPKEGMPAEEIAALLAELRQAGALP